MPLRYLSESNLNSLKYTAFCLCLVWTSLLDAQSTQPPDFGVVLESEVAKGNLISSDLQEYALGSVHTSSISGVTYYYLQQAYQGVDIDGAIAIVSREPDHNLRLLNSRWQQNIVRRSSSQATTQQIGDIANSVLSREGISHAKRAASKVKSRPLWIVRGEQLKFVVEICFHKEKNYWRVFSDLAGNVLERRNLALHCNHDHLDRSQIAGLEPAPRGLEPAQVPNLRSSEVGIEPALGESYLVYPLGTTSPNMATQALVTDPADPLASPFGWHDTNGAEGAEFFDTRGNNASVQEDTLALDGGGFRPSGGSDLMFLSTHDPKIDDAQQISAGLTNLFYWININHDILYHHGFDEAAGNFQLNNYGAGGIGNDAIIGDAFDGGGTNNAVFYLQPDGEQSRMETFLWTGSVFDTEIIVGNLNDPLMRIPAVENGFSQANQLVRVGQVSATAVQVRENSGSTLACNPTQISNPQTLQNRIAVVDRGECFFIAKAENLAQHQAAAMIVIQNTPANPFAMGGSNGTLRIPSVMISKTAGESLREILDNDPTIPLTIRLRPPEIGRAASLDNSVITHEYAHGLTGRLTGGKQTITCLLNFEQMSEGWSDYFGLMFTTDWRAAQAGNRYGIGNYLVGDEPGGAGIRVFPYSRDIGINPLTYDDLPDLQIPHGIGELWAATLWDMTWNMIEQDGIATDLYQGVGGNTNAMKIIIEALKIQPCNPGFVDARDALLTAASALGWEKYHYAIWSAFARRGLGEAADQGRADNPFDGESDFDIPARFATIVEGFKAAPEKDQMTIQWESKQEYGSTAFIVERRDPLGAVRIFDPQNAAFISTTPINYQATDESVIPSQWYTYDLFLEEVDGNRIFIARDSAIIIPTDEIAVFPQPAHQELFVTAGNLQQSISSILIFDAQGKLIIRDNQVLDPYQTRRFSVAQFPSGIYYLQSQSGSDLFWRKFVVQ